MPALNPELRIVRDPEELERAAAGEFARLARQAGPKRPLAVALSGGRTPQGMYARLAQDPYRNLVPWQALRSEEHTSELQSPCNLVCRLLLEKKKKDIHEAHK